MNPTIKDQWIAALLSGEYTQGKGSLHPASDTYCCLGVLTDLYCKERGINGEHRRIKLSYSILSKEVSDWAELGSLDPEIGPLDGSSNCRIASANDGIDDLGGLEVVRPRTFPEIAEIIKEKL